MDRRLPPADVGAIGRAAPATKQIMTSSANAVLASLLSREVTQDEKILLANQRTADRKRRKEKQERMKARVVTREKKMLLDLDHVIPDFSTAEYEKKLLKIATKGGMLCV